MDFTIFKFVKLIKGKLMESLKSKVAGALIKPQLKALKDEFDYEEYGGAPVLGVNKPVIKMHGSSSATAVKNSILRGLPYAEEDIVGVIRTEMLKIQEFIEEDED